MSDIMGTVTMCRRAGKLQMGMDMTKDACANGVAKGVLVATDISEKSLKEVKFVCKKYNTPIYSLGISMEEVGFKLGKKIGIAAVCDKGFMKKIGSVLEEVENDTEIL
ncbi:MAG: 50S ribosomal protein L7 [Ruminococcus sp.]|nr:50S ribosomal protein L7 [Ruminococcus sp.]